MKKLSLVALIGALSAPVIAEPTLYGKANVSLQNASEGDESAIELSSNASRLGVKGNIDIDDSLQAIYQFEFETNVDDGDKGGETITQRNIFIGLKGSFGTVKAGKFDSPLKQAQKKVDLFNDLEGDIKNVITVNDQRPSNIVSYTTKEAPVVGNIAVIASEDEDVDNGVSASVAYDQNDIYVALAYDSNVAAEELDAIRLVAQYQMGNFVFGALFEDADFAGESADGWVVSGAYNVDKWTWKVQAGQSDMVEEGGQSVSVGFDYNLAKPIKLFTYYTANESDISIDNDYLGVGIEAKF